MFKAFYHGYHSMMVQLEIKKIPSILLIDLKALAYE